MQKRYRPSVTLTLDPQIREAAEGVLANLPTHCRVSLSRLIDLLVDKYSRLWVATADKPMTIQQRGGLPRLAAALVVADLIGVDARNALKGATT